MLRVTTNRKSCIGRAEIGTAMKSAFGGMMAFSLITITAAVASVLIFSDSRKIRSSDIDCFDLNAAVGSIRILTGRVTCGLSPLPGSAKGTADPDQLSRIGMALERSIERSPRGKAKRLFGLSLLADGKLDEALKWLTEATLDRPGDAELLNDVVAVYIEKFERDGSPGHLLEALSTLGQVDLVENSFPEICFNKAIVLEDLYLESQALKEWRRCLLLEPDPDWQAEARSHIAALKNRPRSRSFKQDLEVSLRRKDSTAIKRMVVLQPQIARGYAEDLLGAWATAEFRQPHSGDYLLGQVSELGNYLAARTGDRMLLKAVELIDSSRVKDTARLKLLAKGHLAFALGTNYLENDYFDEGALAQLETARDDFRRSGSPFLHWAEIKIAICRLYQGNFSAALKEATRLASGAGLDPYPVIRARAAWVKGLSYMRLAKLSDALWCYQEALASFTRMGEGENMAAVSFLIAENLRFLGNTQEAWKHRYAALKLGCSEGYPIWCFNSIFDAAECAIKDRDPELAQVFQNEMVAIADRTRNPLLQSQALLRRSRTSILLGELDAADRDLRTASIWIEKIEGSARKEARRAELEDMRSSRLLSIDPELAETAISQSIEQSSRSTGQLLLSPLLQKRGQIRLVLGKTDEAQDDFETAITTHEVENEKISNLLSAELHAQRGRAVYTDMIRLQLQRDRADLALSYLEREKLRTIADSSSVWNDMLSAKEFKRDNQAEMVGYVRKSLAPGVSIVEYALIDDDLVVWVIDRDRMNCLTIYGVADDIRSSVPEWIALIAEQKDSDLVRTLAESLYDVLLTPLWDLVKDQQQLVIVPDGALSAVPFAALFDRKEEQFVVQRQSVVTAPSSIAYVALGERYRVMNRSLPVKALLAASDGGDLPGLPMLRFVKREVDLLATVLDSLNLLRVESKEDFLNALTDADIVHFAGHAVVGSDEGLGSALVFDRGKGPQESQLLYSHEILSIRTRRTRLATLSACRSGRITSAGRVDYSSLAQSFLASGVPVVVASFWSVEDSMASAFFGEFYKRYGASHDVAASLYAVQRELLARSEDPFLAIVNWGAFGIFGAPA